MFELKVIRERRVGYGAPRQITASAEVFEVFRDWAISAHREEFIVIPLDNKNHPLGFHVASVGTVSASLVHPREAFVPVLLAGGSSLIVIHNHPSGDPTPSPEDRNVTGRLRRSGELLGVALLDHVIIGDGRYYSFADHGELSGT